MALGLFRCPRCGIECHLDEKSLARATCEHFEAFHGGPARMDRVSRADWLACLALGVYALGVFLAACLL